MFGFLSKGFHFYNLRSRCQFIFASQHLDKMKRLLFLTAVLFADLTFAQETKCNCSKALDQLMDKIENNYPGFDDKTKDKESYHDFKTSLIS